MASRPTGWGVNTGQLGTRGVLRAELRGMLRRLLQPPARLGLSALASPLLVSRALIRPAVATRTFMSVALNRSPLWAAPALGSLARGAPLAPRIATRSMTAHTMGAPRKKRRVDKPRKQKLKSHHGARKRFKMRDDGRWVHWRIGRQHLVTGTSANVRRAKRKPKLVMGNRWQRKLRMLMPYGCRFTRHCRNPTPNPNPNPSPSPNPNPSSLNPTPTPTPTQPGSRGAEWWCLGPSHPRRGTPRRRAASRGYRSRPSSSPSRRTPCATRASPRSGLGVQVRGHSSTEEGSIHCTRGLPRHPSLS